MLPHSLIRSKCAWWGACHVDTTIQYSAHAFSRHGGTMEKAYGVTSLVTLRYSPYQSRESPTACGIQYLHA